MGWAEIVRNHMILRTVIRIHVSPLDLGAKNDTIRGLERHTFHTINTLLGHTIHTFHTINTKEWFCHAYYCVTY
jgi:hypothetical protein